jgi:hypothetical protein
MSIPRCPVFLLNVALSSGGNSTNITVRGSNWGEHFIYDSNKKTWIVPTNIILGFHYGIENAYGIGIGSYAGLNTQATYAIAIGLNAGQIQQQFNAIAIGQNTGQYQQHANAIAIGQNAGQYQQQNGAIAIGQCAGQYGQQNWTIAVGQNAGQTGQQNWAIAIGQSAGALNQSTYAIAIGPNAGQTGQPANSIAIGPNTNTATANQIIMDASFSTPLGVGITGGVFIRPIRGTFSSGGTLSYDINTKEVLYNASSRRYKYDICDLSQPPISSIYELQPKEFKYKLNGDPDIGFIAEEAIKINPAFVYLDNIKQIPEGIRWNAITVSLLLELKRLKARKEALLLKRNNIFCHRLEIALKAK